MWLGLGLVFQYFYELGVVIGGLGFIYYIFKAYEEVAPFKEGENTPEARKDVINELITLRKLPSMENSETNKSSNKDAASSASS